MSAPFTPARFLRKLLGRTRTRQLEAAGGGRRWPDAHRNPNTASAIHGGAGVVSARAAHFVANNATGARIADTLPAHLVGTGIRPICQSPREDLRRTLHRAFELWTDRADAAGLTDWYGMKAGAARDMVVHGEALWVWVDAPDGTPQLIRLHPEQLDRSFTKVLSETRYAVQGVEFDRATGRRIAYHIRPAAEHGPGGWAAGSLGVSFSPSRYPAADVIHMFRPLVPGQVRGLSWLAPVLMTAHELDQLQDALLVRAKVAAMHTGFIYDADGGAGAYQGTQTGTTLDVSLEPGTMSVLTPGKRVEFSSPPDSGDAPALATHFLRQIAAGVGLTYEQLTGDYSQVNYSSQRAAMLEFRRFCESIQHHVIVHQLCRPVWDRFMRWQVLRGTVPATAYQDPASGLQAAKWLPPSWPWVDPLKDARAAIMEMEAGLRSRADIIAERGYDVEEIDRQIAADKRRAQALGIAPQDQTGPPDAA